MSAKRLVIARACGFPFTWLNINTGPPSRCFCSPVISRSGFTSTSVVRTSPSDWRNSNVLRNDVMSRVARPVFDFFSSATVVVIVTFSFSSGSHLELGVVEAEPFREHFFVVLTETGGGTPHTPRRFAQLIGDHPVALRADLRMLHRLPDIASEELRIVEEILLRVHHRRVDTGFLEALHQLVCVVFAGCSSDRSIDAPRPALRATLSRGRGH